MYFAESRVVELGLDKLVQSTSALPFDEHSSFLDALQEDQIKSSAAPRKRLGWGEGLYGNSIPPKNLQTRASQVTVIFPSFICAFVTTYFFST